MRVPVMLFLIIIRATAEETGGSYWCNLSGFSVIEAKFGDERHLLCLKMVPIVSSRLAKVSRVFLDPELAGRNETQFRTFHPGNVVMASGFPLVAPSTGSAEGYVGEDGHFYGHLHLGNRTLYADPYNKDNPDKHFGPFEDEEFSISSRPRRDFAQKRVDPKSILKANDTPTGAARARICELLLLADKEFFDKDANGSLKHAVSRMVHAVNQAEVIFRNADFDEDGMPDNIGFSVKYILVLASEETNARVFGSDGESHAVDGRSYLMQFSRLRRLSEVCLGIAFSGHSFQNRTLGLSFTSLGGGLGTSAGGLCDRRVFGRSFNTLAIAHATGNGDERVPERIAALTLAHEMGHSFGAHHDDNFPNKQCQGFLMGAQSSAANNPQHFQFSLCSKRLIANTLNAVSHCLYEERRAYCGNGIVEENEVCDCGLPVRCLYSDPCCTPHTGGAEHYEEGTLHKSGCSVAPIVACHPSQGACCKGDCTLADLSSYGIDCSRLGQECSCTDSSCNCGLGGRCLSDGSCHAAECAAQGLMECQCTPATMDGMLKTHNMCGICCLLPDNRCVTAETAARPRTDCPLNWCHNDYNGPNLTVEIESCRPTTIRAWPVGSLCVTKNLVGICKANGVCVTLHTPRANRYPESMRALVSGKLVKNKHTQIQISTTLILFLLVFLMVK